MRIIIITRVVNHTNKNNNHNNKNRSHNHAINNRNT